MYEGRSILYRYAQPNRKYSCYKYKETKQQTGKWREPPAIELITRGDSYSKNKEYTGMHA